MMHSEKISDLRPDFERKGFAHVRAFFSASELTDVRSKIDRYLREVAPGLESHLVLFDVEGERRAVKQAMDMDKADPFFADLVHHSKARRLAEALLGEEVVPHTA